MAGINCLEQEIKHKKRKKNFLVSAALRGLEIQRFLLVAQGNYLDGKVVFWGVKKKIIVLNSPFSTEG